MFSDCIETDAETLEKIIQTYPYELRKEMIKGMIPPFYDLYGEMLSFMDARHFYKYNPIGLYYRSSGRERCFVNKKYYDEWRETNGKISI